METEDEPEAGDKPRNTVIILDETSPDLVREGGETIKYRVCDQYITYQNLKRLMNNEWLESDVNSPITFFTYLSILLLICFTFRSLMRI